MNSKFLDSPKFLASLVVLVLAIPFFLLGVVVNFVLVRVNKFLEELGELGD